MTATAVHQSQALTEWTKIFPKLIMENYTSSVTFMKQLTVIAVSAITYEIKDVFPEDSYVTQSFMGMKLKILKTKCRDEVANFLSTALISTFGAFNKKYLHQFALCFYEGECTKDNLVEYHVFEYSYNTEGATVSVSSKSQNRTAQTTKFTFDKVREETGQLIRNYLNMFKERQIKPLDNLEVSLRLYYNDDAPEGYQLPGFTASVENEDHLELTAAKGHELGCVKTPFHQLTARFYDKECMAASYEAMPAQSPPKISKLAPDFNGKDENLAEYFASQESQQNPIKEELGPLEKVSSQNASNLGGITNLDKKKTTKRKINKEIVEDMPNLRTEVGNKRVKTKEEIKEEPMDFDWLYIK